MRGPKDPLSFAPPLRPRMSRGARPPPSLLSFGRPERLSHLPLFSLSDVQELHRRLWLPPPFLSPTPFHLVANQRVTTGWSPAFTPQPALASLRPLFRSGPSSSQLLRRTPRLHSAQDSLNPATLSSTWAASGSSPVLASVRLGCQRWPSHVNLQPRPRPAITCVGLDLLASASAFRSREGRGAGRDTEKTSLFPCHLFSFLFPPESLQFQFPAAVSLLSLFDNGCRDIVKRETVGRRGGANDANTWFQAISDCF